MAHQFSALHRDGFVRVSHKTRERLREVNMLALGLITEMSAHIDGFPVTLNAIIKRAKKPGATALREAYQDLIDEHLVVYVRYTLQLPGKRPYPSATTVIAHEAVTDEEFATEIVAKFKPGQVVLDRQADDEVRKVKVLAATVRYWDGEKKITEDGSLIAPGPKKKSGPKKGSRIGKQPTKTAPPKSGVELGASSSTPTRHDTETELVNVEPGTSGSTLTRENDASAQDNVELDNMNSTTPSSLTRPGDKTTNQTTGQNDDAVVDESVESNGDGWLDGEPNGENPDPDSEQPAAAHQQQAHDLLTNLPLPSQARFQPNDEHVRLVSRALELLSPNTVTNTLTHDLESCRSPGGVVRSRRMSELADAIAAAEKRQQQREESSAPVQKAREEPQDTAVKQQAREEIQAGLKPARKRGKTDKGDPAAMVAAAREPSKAEAAFAHIDELLSAGSPAGDAA